MRRVKQEGFTLVELLVVISIIALLLAILMPSLQKARATAQRLACAAQQRQSGIAINVYLNDSRGTYMFYSDKAVWSGYNPSKPSDVANNIWYQKLINGKYIISKALGCVSHKVPKQYDTKARNLSMYGIDSKVSYGMSIAFAHDYGTTGFPAKAWKVTEIRQPSTKIVITDSAHIKYPEIGAYCIYSWAKVGAPYGDDSSAWPRHQGGYCNVIWADTHASTVKATNPKNWATIYDSQALTSMWGTPDYWSVARGR